MRLSLAITTTCALRVSMCSALLPAFTPRDSSFLNVYEYVSYVSNRTAIGKLSTVSAPSPQTAKAESCTHRRGEGRGGMTTLGLPAV